MKYLLLFLILTLSAFYTTPAQTNAGNALSLDGNNGYAWVPDNPSLNPQNQITLEAWVWSNNYDGSSWQEFIMKGGNDPSTPRQYYIRPFQGRGTLQFLVHDTDNNDRSAGSEDTLANGVWYHIAGTYDGQYLRCYINGSLQSEDDEGQFSIQTSDGILAFGRLGEIAAEYFEGKIDEVRLWNFSRNQSQLISTITDTLSSAYYTTSDSGLIGYWRFDELEDLGINSDGGDDVRDLSVFGNHADLEGGATLEPSQALVSVEKIDNLVPDNFYLSNNYPNPFNPSTTIEFSIPQTSHVTLEVFNTLGKSVGLLVSKELTTGTYNYKWNATNLPSGVYFYRITAETFTQVNKMMLLK